jgi:hypothetical protein
MEVIASSRREMHKKQLGRATIAPRSTTEAVDEINNIHWSIGGNLTDVAPYGGMYDLVSRPEYGVDAMNDVTKNQPSDERHRRNSRRVDLSRKSQDEQSDGEEG